MAACPRCGSAAAAEARYCASCGAPLGPPRAARELRKTVTVLFCDLVHSTGIAERVDAEALRHVQLRFFDEMRRAVERHGGVVEKFIGDEVMAVFGVPQTHEDDALRAVRAAAEMQERRDRLNEELEPRGIRLEMRIGVNTGEVIAGDPSSGETFVTGEPVVLAKRLEQAAEPGDILIGRQTYALVRDAVAAGPLETFSAKGKREPVGRRRVHEVHPDAPGIGRRLDAPMVGRDAELARLHAAFDAVESQSACRRFTVLGPAGIGKSRLVAELASSVAGRATTLHGRCLAYGDGITFWPLVQVLRDAGDEAVADALADDADGDRVLEILGGITGSATPSSSLEETFWAVRRTLEALARPRPLVVSFEDIHWAEPTFLDLVEYVEGWSRSAPILIVCLARPDLIEARPTWVAPSETAETIALEPLSAGETKALLDGLGGEETLSPVARERIARTAEGNPLFLEQMAAMAAESEGGDPAVPPSIQALLSERLDRLGGEERSIVERAAVVGAQFSSRAVAELTPPDDRSALPARLLSLVRKQLIEPDAPAPGGEDRFRFRHGLVRDVAYDAMAKALRAGLHERLADWIEHDGAAPELEEVIGYHVEQAYVLRTEVGDTGDAVRALAVRAGDRLATAGRRALGRGDPRAAVALLQRAATLAADAPERRIPVLVVLGTALRDAGSLDASDRVLADAVEAATSIADGGGAARARVERAFTRMHWSETLPGAGQVADDALPVLTEVGDDDDVARALNLKASVEYIHCRVGAAEALWEQALDRARRAGERRLEVRILTLLAKASVDGPRPAEEGIARVRAMRDRLPGDRVLEAVSSSSQAPLEAMCGRFEEARALYRHAQAIFEELGQLLWVANARLDSGLAELLAGDAPAAERELRLGYEQLESMGGTSLLSSVSALLGEALAAQGRLEEAERCAGVSERTSSPHDVFSQVEWRVLHATVCARTGRAKDALRAADEAGALLEGTDALLLRAAAAAALAEAFSASGLEREARAARADALRLARQKGNVAFAERDGRQPDGSSPSRSSASGLGAGFRAGGT